MSWRTACFCILVLALQSFALAQEAGVRYRVAGVIITADQRLAMLEASSGEQKLYTESDLLEQYRIERIEDKGVWLNDNGRRLFLRLQGIPTTLDELEAASRSRELRVVEGVGTYRLDYDDARLAFDQLDAPPTDQEAKNPDFKYARMVGALRLPIMTRIVAVDGRPANSFDHARFMIDKKLESGQVLRMTVEGVPGVDTIYGSPSE